MIYGVVLIGELLLLYLFSQLLSKSISLLFQIFRFHQILIVFIMGIIFLPGTLIHELAHWFMAKLLFVPTGKISLLPKLQGNTIRMGTAEVGKSDIVRQLLIGVAPFILGITILFLSFYFLLPKLSSLNYVLLDLFIYLLFTISNSMFSSKRDLEGIAFFLFILIICFSLLIIFDKEIIVQLQTLLSLLPARYWQTAIYYLLIPLTLDIIILIVLRLFIQLFK